MDKTEKPSKNLLTSVFSVYFCVKEKDTLCVTARNEAV